MNGFDSFYILAMYQHCFFLYKNESTRDLKSPRFVSMEVASVDVLE